MVHSYTKNRLFTEIATSPLVLFTFSSNSWSYLKRTARDQGLEKSFLPAFSQQREKPFALGFIDWARRFFLTNLHDLLGPTGSTHMFKADEQYVIHPLGGPCLSADSNAPVTAPIHQEDLLTQELEGFPWGKRGLRLLRFLRLKGIVNKDQDTIETIPLVDFLKVVVNPEPPFSEEHQQRRKPDKIIKILKGIKAKGVLIPDCYIGNRRCTNVFWKK